MKICLKPTPDSPVGGVMNCVWSLANQLIRMGHQIVDIDAADILHSHALDGSPHVYTSHGTYPLGHHNFAANEILYNHIASADIVTAVSRWTANQFAHLGVKPEIIHNGVDLEGLQQYRSQPQNYIIWGKVTADEVSNADKFVELARSLPGLQFVMTVAPVEAVIPRNLKVIGIQSYPDMMRWIGGALVYVSTGTENDPIQVKEAMALGVPVVALPLGGVSEIDGIRLSESLSDDMSWAIKHREQQSKAGLKSIRDNYTWEIIAKKYVEVYSRALKVKHPQTVSVVIPCYNLARTVSRAIDSCLKQSVKPDEIIVVDDGSKDELGSVLRDYGKNIKVIHQENSGVSAARNNGIDKASGEYICCLDADDAISVDFIERTKKALSYNYRLGLAYTGMTVVAPTSYRPTGDFPGETGGLVKLSRSNFIPCANLFRKKAWKACGGYKNINPSWEDYDLWLSIMEHGFAIQHVPRARLIYTSHNEGRSGMEQKENHGKLLRATVDGYHERLYGNAGHATFVIPCYNQWQYVYDAVKSAWEQSYPHIEVIVVDDKSTQDRTIIDPILTKFSNEFPKTKVIWCPENGGLSYARNIGISQASGAYIVPLDADDKVDPAFVSECLKLVYNTTEYAYTDIYLWHNEGKGPVEPIEMPTFDPDRLKTNHQHACTILVKKAWLDFIGGYDEKMDAWEDYDCAIRLVKSGHCGRRVPRNLFYYRWRPNSMRQEAEKRQGAINKYLWNKHSDVAQQGVSLMACCGPNHVLREALIPQIDLSTVLVPEGMVMLVYKGAKRGEMTKFGGEGRVYRYCADKPLFMVAEADLMVFSVPIFEIAKRPEPKEQQVIAPVAAQASDPIDINEVFPEGEDDLTALDGVTPDKQSKLYEMGINTYQRLVAASNEQLEPVFTRPQAKKVKSKAVELIRQNVGV